MIALRAFEAGDLRALDLQESQKHMRAWLTDEMGGALVGSGAMTATVDRKPVACAGIADMDGQRYAWALLGCDAGPAMLRASRECALMLNLEPGPVVTHVSPDVGGENQKQRRRNMRWLALLGFAPTGRIDRLPDGKQYQLWARL